jgi:hypothetical protein
MNGLKGTLGHRIVMRLRGGKWNVARVLLEEKKVRTKKVVRG